MNRDLHKFHGQSLTAFSPAPAPYEGGTTPAALELLAVMADAKPSDARIATLLYWTEGRAKEDVATLGAVLDMIRLGDGYLANQTREDLAAFAESYAGAAGAIWARAEEIADFARGDR